jgi:hypothetical protein
MQIDKRSRTQLKQYFVKNAIPTESNFAELIEGMLSQRDDGIAKPPNDALSIEAVGDDTSQKKAIHFYNNFSDPNPTWVLSLNPRQDPANAATAKAGFSISDGAGNSRLFIDRGTGNVGVGTISPRAGLHIDRGATNNVALMLSSSGAGWGSGLQLENTAAGVAKTFGIYVAAGMLRFTDENARVDRMLITKDGDVGIGAVPSGAKLQVAGTVKANRFVSDNTLVLNDYTTVNPTSNVYLYSPPNDRDAWIYLDSADAGSNWGIYHRQIDSAGGVKGLPPNSIGFIGGGSKLQAYIGLADGSAFFAGNTSITGKLTVDGGVQANSNLRVSGNAGVLDLEGTNHAYIQLYPMKASAGRKGWIGYGNPDTTIMAIRNDAGELELNGKNVRVVGDLDIENSASLGWARAAPDFNVPLRSGLYQWDAPTGRPPDTSHSWCHLIVVRHSNKDNHHQLQIASSYSENDRLFFRKIARNLDETARPAWNEVATVTDGKLKIGDWTLEATADSLFIKKGTSTVARFSTAWDRFLVFQNLNGKLPYFFYNESGNFGKLDLASSLGF